MTTAASESPLPAAIERVLVGGDLARLSEQERLGFYSQLCGSLGLNPLTKPFEYITLNGKLQLYANKNASEQLRSVYGVSILKLEKEFKDDLYIVTVYAQNSKGRTDISTGAKQIAHLKGEQLANALMATETKAKRRVTLSICGLGMLDETEVESIPTARTLQPLVVQPLLPAADDGLLRITKVEPYHPSAKAPLHANVILSNGVQLVAKGEGLVQTCEEVVQNSEPIDVETRKMKKRDGTAYEQLLAVHRVLPPVDAVATPSSSVATPPPPDDDIPF